mmetsp:Transcript_27960/g.27001  ORF Transcript_27960/g.27001 Transcript_27960/m.27001 type:complete len:138 (+) Transcript_27960:801-1214(+)|eukprot:CAMPEP_0170551734 /NCGR_PEP_ID=MMETSP0211-20121228/9737_1 /TAXON_ID=311385 /ORGANISM="Pseudokeronopsis sp., Strain OXSARD2" /LENGTH=137 /DNA_ID=CAMNT_0010859089 /DNA_START=787 /DNA_END=1200 /DNA_ORIENTATION=+
MKIGEATKSKQSKLLPCKLGKSNKENSEMGSSFYSRAEDKKRESYEQQLSKNIIERHMFKNSEPMKERNMASMVELGRSESALNFPLQQNINFINAEYEKIVQGQDKGKASVKQLKKDIQKLVTILLQKEGKLDPNQ